MLLEETITALDAKWNNCWPTSSLRPFAILDLISYLFFVKKLEDEDFKGKRIPELSTEASFYDEELMEFSWQKLKDMDAKDMHYLFTKQYGIIDLMTNYSTSGLQYSDCFKVLPVVTPTAQLLSNSVAIVDIIEGSNKTMHPAIAGYLLGKSEITGQSGQADIPEYLARIVVALMRPSSADIVWDPLAGNASLLVSVARYITSGNRAADPEATTEISYGNISGMETDLIHLRIGSMNMILNGIANPPLKIADVYPGYTITLPNKPSIIISNLFFTGIDSKMAVDNRSQLIENTRKEISFLHLILKNLRPGARAAVIVPDAILYSNQLPIKRIREEIVENCTLEAVISLPAKKDALFSAGAMLIISKQSVPTSTVWFYKLPLLPEVSNERFAGADSSSFNIAEQYTIDTILNYLKNKNSLTETSADNHFYVTAEQLRANGHNFNYNQYGLILKRPFVPADLPIINPVAERTVLQEDNAIDEARYATEIPVIKKSITKKIVLLVVSIMAIAGALGYYFLNIGNTGPLKPGTQILSDSIQNASSSDSTNLAADTSGIAPKHYIVISKAYFYSEPNEKGRETGYLTHWSRGELIPAQEQNDFVYVTFNSAKGKIIKGWLNKKDLKVTE